jgi:DNA-binding LacI/PurR family transcriptional regulator
MAGSRGTKRVTLAEVAAAAGVSPMTASYAYSRPARVSAESRAKVRAAAERLGYAGPDPSARSLRRGRTNCLGVVLGEHLTYAFDDPQASAFLAGIAEVCAARGFGMTILPITGAGDDPERVRAAGVDGFVVWTTADDDPVIAALRAQRRPVIVHSGPAVDGFGLVSIDNRAAARAIGRIVFAGARRPAAVSFPLGRDRASDVTRGLRPGAASFPVTRQRLQGFRDAARDLGLRWESVPVAVAASNERAEAEALTARLLRGRWTPDAIAVMSDKQAAGVLDVVRATGRRVPQDVAISGWDDSAAAGDLGLTTVAQDLRAQGAACATAALDDDVRRQTAPWRLVLRASTRG